MKTLFSITLLDVVDHRDGRRTEPVSFCLEQETLIEWLSSNGAQEGEMLARCEGLAKGVAVLVNELEGKGDRRAKWFELARALEDARKAARS